MSKPLEYAGPGAVPVRTSKLPVASMFLSMLSCPCVSAIFCHWLEQWHWIGALEVKLLVLLGLVLAPVLAITARIRINRSRGQMIGNEYVNFAFTFSALWLVLLGFFLLVLSGIPAIGPRD